MSGDKRWKFPLLIFTLVHRALLICSNVTLQAKLRIFFTTIHEWLPDQIIGKTNARKVKDFKSPTLHAVKKCPIYLHLPWLGTPSVTHEKKIKNSVEKCFFAVEQRVIFTSRPLLPAIKKNVLPPSPLSYVVYNFLCHCNSRYVSRTSQRLQNRIRRHVPKFIKTGQISNSRDTATRFGEPSTPVMFNEFAIGQHFLDNPMCSKIYSDKKFTILSFGRSSFHLFV